MRLPFGLLLTDQPPRRNYTCLRNQIATLRLPHVPLGHKLRFALTLPVRLAMSLMRASFGPEIREAIAGGLRDGVRSLARGGPVRRTRP